MRPNLSNWRRTCHDKRTLKVPRKRLIPQHANTNASQVVDLWGHQSFGMASWYLPHTSQRNPLGLSSGSLGGGVWHKETPVSQAIHTYTRNHGDKWRDFWWQCTCTYGSCHKHVMCQNKDIGNPSGRFRRHFLYSGPCLSARPRIRGRHTEGWFAPTS